MIMLCWKDAARRGLILTVCIFSPCTLLISSVENKKDNVESLREWSKSRTQIKEPLRTQHAGKKVQLCFCLTMQHSRVPIYRVSESRCRRKRHNNDVVLFFIYFWMSSVIRIYLHSTCAALRGMFIALQLQGHLNHERHFVLNTEERISITRLSSPHKGICVKMLSGAAKAIFECLIPRAENLSTRLQMHFNC